MASVTLKNLYKRFDNFVAVKDVNLEIKDGEFLVLVGPSGCGKSTTLKMIAGLEEVSEGYIHIGTKDVTHLEPKDRNIAMVFQNYALYPHMDVYHNMSFGLKVRKVDPSEIDRRVKEVSRVLGIEELLKRKPKQLSGGQMQRVALGRAIIRNPDLFLFDEPLSNLDAKLRVKMRFEITRLHNDLKCTTVYVTHDQVEAMTLGDRIVIMKDGVVNQIGSPLEVYDRPINRFVASFIGSPEMNFIDGNVVREKEQLRFVSDDGCVTQDLDPKKLFRNADNGVVLGIRPEHIRFTPKTEGLGYVQIEVVEHLGFQTMIMGRTGCVQITALVDRMESLKSGVRVGIDIDPGMVHLFDRQSGVSLMHN
ncbi:MAG: ABC transporter ATP-binding protein [Syntrophales bacterium]